MIRPPPPGRPTCWWRRWCATGATRLTTSSSGPPTSRSTHPHVAESYRAAHAVFQANEQGLASTDDLRQAFVHYRSHFAQLLGVKDDGRREVTRGPSAVTT
jgi:hypothetical protein